MKRAMVCLLTVMAAGVGARACQACTGIRLTAKDGTVVYARTMEFGVNLYSSVMVIPRQYSLTGTTNSGNNGLAWKSRHAAVGMNGIGLTQLADGVNEAGLAGGMFYMPGYAEYQAVSKEQESQSLAPWEVITWILTNFATVEEVRAGIRQVRVGSVVFQGEDMVPPLHYIVHDAQGHSLVIEYLHGELTLRDNPIGTFTNSPEFDWHLTNLRNYVHLSADNAPADKLHDLTLSQLGQGSGMTGLPGDFTPPSRFVRAFALSQSSLSSDNGPGAVRQAFHVLDSFDIPQGAIRTEGGNPANDEYTQWTAASDTHARTYYFHSYNNRRIRKVELLKANLDSPNLLSIPLDDQEDVQNLTPGIGEN